MSTYISFRIPEENLLWFPEKDDSYSMKSTYHCIGMEKGKFELEASGVGENKHMKERWNANLFNAARNFLWRLTNDIPPLRSN